MEECIDDEILALKSIYEDELEISDAENSKEIRITLTPATANDEASKYVCFDMCIKIPKSYPSSSPQFNITRSRGLSDEYLKELNDKLLDLIEENIGNCVLFDILDLAKEHLTDNNIPSDICSICLCGFRRGNDFLKTKCFHYFHRYCLKDYKDHVFTNSIDGILSLIEDTDKLSLEKSIITVPCPVCKTLCEVNSDSIDDTTPPENEEVVIDYESLEKQRRKFEKLYRLQLEKGGVIDVEKEKNKFLLSNLQQNYDAYIASKELDDANDNKTPSPESPSCGKPSNNAQKFHKHFQGSNRGRWMTRRNFTQGRHHRNRNNHQRFYANPQQHQSQRVDAPCTSSGSQNFPTKHENQTQTYVKNMHPPPLEHSFVKKRGGYHKMSTHDSKNPNPSSSNAAQSRGGGYGGRRPYGGSWMNNKRKDFSRSKMSHEKSSVKSSENSES